MKVCSQQVVSYTPDGHQVEWFVTTLDGFRCMHHQVKIRSRSTSGSIDLLTYNTSQELYDLLSTGKISGYILCDHKQLCYLSGDEVLNIWIDDRIVKFPCCIGKKLLLFLSHDSEDTNQCCFDLCFKVCLNSYNDSELLNKNVSYDDQWRHIGESELKPGDAVLLGTDTSGKHAAITLGNNMYLSKLGNGGALFVMTMKAMMNAYQCKNFVLIEPTITRYKKFWHDYKKNNFYNTSIRF